VNEAWPATRQRLCAGVLLAAALCAPARGGPTGQPEPELRQRLALAMTAADGFEDRFDAEIWLADMSTRMQRFRPAAFPDAPGRLDFLRAVHAEARRARVSPELVLAVINVESGFDRLAISRSGAFGFMQIMPFWLDEIGHSGDNLFDARTNLRMGCTILRYYLDRERDSYVRALARYNGSGGKPDYPYRVLHALNHRWSPY
jgi:soluble lytic murein transglycosylase-like protein